MNIFIVSATMNKKVPNGEAVNLLQGYRSNCTEDEAIGFYTQMWMSRHRSEGFLLTAIQALEIQHDDLIKVCKSAKAAEPRD